MPKDKDTSIRGFGITMKKAEERTIQLAADPAMEEEKAEPCEAQDCYYFASDSKCPGPMGDECHYVIKNGRMVMAHKSCHKRDQGGVKKTPNMIIR